MKTSEISVQNPIAIAIAGTPAIQKAAPWLRANAIALVMENLPEAAVKGPPWEFNKLVEDLLSRSQGVHIEKINTVDCNSTGCCMLVEIG